MKDYKLLQKACMSEVIAAGIVPGNITEWKLNFRAKSRWGRCVRDSKTGTYRIEINSQLITDDRISEKACKETIIHEILHSCKDCMKHTGLWKVYANIMNEKYGYNIKRITTGEEKGVENYKRDRMPVKYVFRCKNCGTIVRRRKACRFTHYYRNYGCGVCGAVRCFVKVE